VTEEQQPDPLAISQGLRKVRQRRWLLWLTILAYLPGLLVALQLGLSGGTMTRLFGLWVVVLCIVVGMATVVRCPRCGNQFHTNGPTFLPLRKCIHCGLHVKADRAGKKVHKQESPP
jgi:uncharacterized membrane protein YhdT